MAKAGSKFVAITDEEILAEAQRRAAEKQAALNAEEVAPGVKTSLQDVTPSGVVIPPTQVDYTTPVATSDGSGQMSEGERQMRLRRMQEAAENQRVSLDEAGDATDPRTFLDDRTAAGADPGTLEGSLQNMLDAGKLVEMGLAGGGGSGGPRRKMTKKQSFAAPIDPRISQELSDASEETEAARGRVAATEAGGALSQARMLQETGETLEGLQEQQAKRRAYFQNRIQEISKDADRLTAEVEEDKVDPNKFWANKSTGAKVGMILAAAFSGAGAALSGQGGNPAMNAINRAIDRDIAAQKSGIAAKRAALGQKNTLLQQARQVFSDEMAATDFSKALYLERAATIGDSIAQATNSDLVRQNNELISAQLREQAAALKAQAAQRQAGQIEIETVQKTGGGRRRPSVDKLLDLQKKILNVRKLRGEVEGAARGKLVTENVKIKPGISTTASEPETLRELISSTREGVQNLNQIEKLRKKFTGSKIPFGTFMDKNRAKFQTLKTLVDLRNESGLIKGPASERESEKIAKLLNARSYGELKSGVDTVKDVLKRSVKSRLQGVADVTPQFAKEFGIRKPIRGFEEK